MEIKKYTSYLNEEVDLTELTDKLSEKYLELKKDLSELINITLEESDLKTVTEDDVKKFMEEYLESSDGVEMIDELIEDNDIFNFYLKHQSDFDELLNDVGYMGKSPEENGVFSLYDVVINGTKVGIKELVKILKDELL